MASLIENLLTRKSQPVIDGDIPYSDIERIIQCALTAPDHRALRPWQFILWSREDCEKLLHRVELVALAEEAGTEPVEDILTALRRLFTNAPRVIVCVLNLDNSGRVPELEQILSTGAAIQSLIVAAEAMGHSAFWRTGKLAYSPLISAALGLASNARICGLVCLGRMQQRAAIAPPLRPELERHFFNLESLPNGEFT